MEKCTECSILVRSENWSRERIEKIYQSKSNAIFLNGTVPVEKFGESVKRNEDDSQGEMLFKRRTRLQRKFVIFV